MQGITHLCYVSQSQDHSPDSVRLQCAMSLYYFDHIFLATAQTPLRDGKQEMKPSNRYGTEKGKADAFPDLFC